jgi:biopolymer transport protein ExbB
MAVVSWLIMVSKAFAIGRVARGNDAFRAVFAEVAPSRSLVGAGISSDDNPVLERSSLYRLYEVAKGEVATRLQDMAQTTGYAFGPQAIASIRSSVEAKLVRETQSLNRQMVMLTIAISGGPFLGLLGTVIGVMITFAAVAAAGDVNVNAIAPGIAAALVATVAGLGVAIPALFAYNYFIVRIKEITADMQVFVNEIVARAAEITLSASYPTGE